MVEHRTVDADVEGSSPFSYPKKIKKMARTEPSFFIAIAGYRAIQDGRSTTISFYLRW